MHNNYYEFKKEKKAIEWIQQNYGDFTDSIYRDSYNKGTLGYALFCYTGSMSKTYNSILNSNNGNMVGVNAIIDKHYTCNSTDYKDNQVEQFFSDNAKKKYKINV